MEPRYEVQHFTICDGWINTWSDEQERPVTYATQDEADRALAEWREEIQAGRDMEAQYGEWEFRIMQVVNW